MIDNFNELPKYTQYTLIFNLIYRINFNYLKKNNIYIYSVHYDKIDNEYCIKVEFGDFIKGRLLYSKTLYDLYKILDRWEKMDYWSLLIEIGDNIDLSKKQLKL